MAALLGHFVARAGRGLLLVELVVAHQHLLLLLLVLRTGRLGTRVLLEMLLYGHVHILDVCLLGHRAIGEERHLLTGMTDDTWWSSHRTVDRVLRCNIAGGRL